MMLRRRVEILVLGLLIVAVNLGFFAVVVVMMATAIHFVAMRSNKAFNTKQPDHAESHPPTEQRPSVFHGLRHDVEKRSPEHDPCRETEVKLKPAVRNPPAEGQVAAQQRRNGNEHAVKPQPGTLGHDPIHSCTGIAEATVNTPVILNNTTNKSRV